MAHPIELSKWAREDVRRITPFHLRTIMTAIQDLASRPLDVDRSKRPLRVDALAGLSDRILELFPEEGELSEPWELRVAGRWRIIYIVVFRDGERSDVGGCPVHVLRVFEKPGHLDFVTALDAWDGLK